MEDDKIRIGFDWYRLVRHYDTSAPCSQCAFLDRNTLKCTFPTDKERGCSIEGGTRHGWNTTEYVAVLV